eukprot:gnl/TRDRNA2_/TRDRNA2_206090_c0_seq1.p1 gnl/TRDRNA2_/TRDRNA2_206090_c0~~gnl/TRDRNA2_/TRDRNA2_206090_c0_seq1.p1  ORF type:complete len:544 (+),score=62.40 gnl/TRDRNA2_/TRDRNA2_206090_c0_seq1:67-1632(+)
MKDAASSAAASGRTPIIHHSNDAGQSSSAHEGVKGRDGCNVPGSPLRHTVILWFRNDLRIRDNPLLHHKLLATASHLIPVYFLDPRHFGSNADVHPHWLGQASTFSKTGVLRARFLLESLSDLQQSFRKLGSDLLVVNGEPEKQMLTLLENLSSQDRCASVLCEHNVGSEEATVESAVAEALRASNVELKTLWGAQTLYSPTDLPFKVAALPEPFTDFRSAVESRRNNVKVKEELPSPRSLPSFPANISGIGTSLEDIDKVLHLLGFSDEEIHRRADERVQNDFVGGERAALLRMEEFVNVGLATYKQTRNGLVGKHFSSKLSPWLAHGCVSPRTVHWAVRAYEGVHGSTSDTYWLIFELMWRDWFRFFAEKHGKAIFLRSGPAQSRQRWAVDLSSFEKWRTGETGVAFVDANMKELLLTGFMSNRGRQNVASFLIHDLGVDWRLGAQWFEHALLDHDPASNYGNWVCAAGLGWIGQRLNKFNIPKQAKDYDPDKRFVKLWLRDRSESKGKGKGKGKSKLK